MHSDPGAKSSKRHDYFDFKMPNLYLLLIHRRISAHPNINFTVVINPGSGPGPNALPDTNYTREIPKLAAHDNVRLLGYVHTTYATRNISLVRKDIETYAAWPTASSNPDLAVRGIFFDETPQQYSANSLAYLQNLTDLTKGLNGFGSVPFVSYTFPFLHFSHIPYLHASFPVRSTPLPQDILLALSSRGSQVILFCVCSLSTFKDTQDTHFQLLPTTYYIRDHQANSSD